MTAFEGYSLLNILILTSNTFRLHVEIEASKVNDDVQLCVIACYLIK